jgi:hypothetical protein
LPRIFFQDAPVQRSTVGTVISIAAALAVAAVTCYISYMKLKEPQILLDWFALAFSGLTTGAITFFVIWGHFQKDPVPPANPSDTQS